MRNQKDSVSKSGMNINNQLPLSGQRLGIPMLKSPQTPTVDFCEIKGQYTAKRALEIAAAGSHHTMLIGPTGSSKTMFIKAFPSILYKAVIGRHSQQRQEFKGLFCDRAIKRYDQKKGI